MENFKLSIIFTLIAVSIAFYWQFVQAGVQAGMQAVFLVLILGLLEVSLSFDNAVVNASVLKRMNALWQHRFLTWGMVIAVFGMRLVFPVAIVTFAADIGFIEVTQMALHDPMQYAHHLHNSHTLIASFGGVFLLLVAFSFLFDETRDVYWLGKIEEKLQQLGKLDAISTTLSLAALLIMYSLVSPEHQHDVLMGGIWGIFLYGLVSSLDSFFQDEDEAEMLADVAKKSGIMTFLYLELLDASFSFDGVIGAFAITRDIVTIMLGLGIGAMFVRSLTIMLVNKGTLDEYVFLEHGAHYAIGALAIIMLVSTYQGIPEVITGLIGALFIGLSLLSSIRYKRAEEKNSSAN